MSKRLSDTAMYLLIQFYRCLPGLAAVVIVAAMVLLSIKGLADKACEDPAWRKVIDCKEEKL